MRAYHAENNKGDSSGWSGNCKQCMGGWCRNSVLFSRLLQMVGRQLHSMHGPIACSLTRCTTMQYIVSCRMRSYALYMQQTLGTHVQKLVIGHISGWMESHPSLLDVSSHACIHHPSVPPYITQVSHLHKSRMEHLDGSLVCEPE